MTEQKISIRYLERSKLKPFECNVMIHSDAQVAQIAASIEEFGWTNPVLIDENSEVIAGHGRLAAAELLEIFSIPTITLRGLTDAQKRAYRIADNKLPQGAAWDDALLKAELESLSAEGFDLNLTGFNDFEIGTMKGEAGDIPGEHWIGMPEFEQEEKQGVKQLIVHFETESDVHAFAELVEQTITDKTKYIWYPAKARERLKDKVYLSDES